MIIVHLNFEKQGSKSMIEKCFTCTCTFFLLSTVFISIISTVDLSVSNSRLEGYMKLLLEKEELEKSDYTHLLKILALL